MSTYVPPTRIHIPTFDSPTKLANPHAAPPRPAAAPGQAQTREEKREARLNSRLGARRAGGGSVAILTCALGEGRLMRSSVGGAAGWPTSTR